MMDNDGLSMIVELADKITTVAILLAAWLFERRERKDLTTNYLSDMRRIMTERLEDETKRTGD